MTLPCIVLFSRRGIYISWVGQEINGWSVSGPIAGGTECPRNLARINSLFLTMALIPC